MHLIGVYGTLKRGSYNHSYLGGAKFVKRARVSRVGLFTRHRLPMAMFTQDPNDFVWVEVYEVPPQVLERVDSLEGHPHCYTRTPVLTDEGDRIEMYLYEVDPQGYNTVKLKDGEYPVQCPVGV